MTVELYALPEAKSAYELVMMALKDRDQPTAVKVATAMVSVSPAGDVLRAVAAAKKQVETAAQRG